MKGDRTLKNINVFFEDRSYRISCSEVEKTVLVVLKQEDSISNQINIIFTDDKNISSLNRKYFNKKTKTDVISFSIDDFCGEVYISLPQARRQANEYKVSIKQEVKRLIIHGVLHLLGYDHDYSNLNSKMFVKQEKYLRMVS
ncbi:MAG: rRNA maturation RNase YbeY [candidate division Zixibacteria bacterium]|nr:rRNA maturation RNase YbeY [candidate division Zixibacteria bacterium]